ncbi:uncharacterized protein LOC123685731 isoform X2 [Harmonia axyridis]|uniref:uncharacterized protein LOC123685731 isoform X2 n=1 Tax=Harmonia axyridis TaxID=115357 RepID=UPI001E2766FC|nr:uncharacterized protein LOC123685731 isoform X2 [Harmonia axyridis]
MNNVDAGKSIFKPFKKFEYILNNKNESFTKKADSVVEVWQNLALCKFENSEIQYIVQIIDWAKLHTLNIVLTGEWKKFKGQYEEPLLKEVKSTQNLLTKINNAFYTRCQKLIDVINNPWSDPILEYLVRTPNAVVGPKEIEFFCVETAYLTSVRLKKLCESQCEDLALNLVKAFMKCYRLSQTDNFNLNATETQVWFIFDIYVALLYKFKENDSLLDMLKGLSAEEGLNLIKRFSKKRVKISKVWKHCHRIAILASQVYISSTILKPIDEIRGILKELLTAYVTLNNTESFLQDVVASVKSIIRLAETAAHIYIFCEVFQEQFESKMKAFIIELYIRALTTDMNLLERQKTDNDKEKIIETTNQLAKGFTNLGDVLKSDINVSRECIMTAFSLQPTLERIQRIEELAKLSGFEVLDTGQVWKCKLHPPVLPTDDVTWICNECGEYMCKPQLNVPLNTNIALNEALTEEKLGITRELCDDLVVLLSSPRYQVFSWLLNWPDLQRLCLMYLNDPERTKNVVTELKFLDIDYSIFATIKKEPLDEYAGIERGYEHYLDHNFDDDQISNASEDTGSQDSRFYSMSSDSASELHSLSLGLKKSDPNTLKSLRMFRPNLKRSRINAEVPVPEKIMKNELADSAIASSSKLTTFPSASTISNQFPVSSIVGVSSFSQESTSSSPIDSIIGINTGRQDLPFSSLTKNGIGMEKPFIPIKLHPPQQNINMEPLGLVKHKDHQNTSVYSNQNLAPIKLHTSQHSNINSDSSILSLQKEYTNPVKSTVSTKNIKPIKHHLPKAVNLKRKSTVPTKPLLSTTNFGPNLKTYANRSNSLTVSLPCMPRALQSMFKDSNASPVNDTTSKNGQVATLQQVGGQVAIDNNLTSKAIIGKPNSSETHQNQASCNFSNLSSVILSNVVELSRKEPVLTKMEDATAKSQECSMNTEQMEVEELNICPSIVEKSFSKEMRMHKNDDNDNAKPEETKICNEGVSSCSLLETKDEVPQSFEMNQTLPEESIICNRQKLSCSLSETNDGDFQDITGFNQTKPVESNICNHQKILSCSLTDGEFEMDQTKPEETVFCNKQEFLSCSLSKTNDGDSQSLGINHTKFEEAIIPDHQDVLSCSQSEIFDGRSQALEICYQRIPEETIISDHQEKYVGDTKGQETNLSNILDTPVHTEEPLLNEVPNLFQDLVLDEPNIETSSKYVKVEFIEVEETKRDIVNVKCYFKKRKLEEKPKPVEELKMDFLLDKDNESIISIDNTIDDYADTLINSDSEYDYFTSTNPILHHVLNTIDSYEEMKLRNMNKDRFIPEDMDYENEPSTSNYEYKPNNNLLVSKENKYKEQELSKNRCYLKKEPKYESCPETGSDSQVESDDQYNRCYIELSRNNLLYDTIKGVFKNVDHYLKKYNNNNIIDLPLKMGKKPKKGYSSKKNKKSKTGNALDKTGLDIDSKIKPKKDISIKDVRIILNRLPDNICKNYLKPEHHTDTSYKNEKDNTEEGTCSKFDNDNEITSFNDDELPKVLVEESPKENDKNKNFEVKNPKVVLERLSVMDDNYVKSVLAKVPGLHDTELMRPSNTDMVVNVVQMAGGRPNASAPVNAQTSTQITPHIQRIGQPRVEKPQGEQTDNSETMVTSTVTSVSSSVKPSTSQPSTLINILSQQVIKPGQSSNCVKTRSTPLINIVSHQIIRPSNQVVSKMLTSSAQTNEQATNIPRSEPSSEQSNAANSTIVKNVQAPAKTATVPTSAPAPGTILQFICKSATLPKFQQAFGKTVYQSNNTETSDSSSAGENSSTTDSKKATPPKNPTVNIQPIQGSVIYTRQVPVGQTINLLPPGRQVFRIATSNPDQISLVKDTVIHSKMSALLTAALQKKSAEVQVENEGNNENGERVTVARPALVQNARIVKPVIQIPTNVIRTSTNTQANLSSTTLEQLREFDMVYKQIKERSNTGTTPIESSTQGEPENSSQGISVTYLNQGQKFTQLSPVVVVSSYCNLQPAASPALSVTSQGSSSPCVTPAPTPTLPKVSSKSSSKGKSLKNATPHASKVSPIPKPQQKPQEDEHTTQRIFDILAEYAEQLRNSPDLNNKPAPRRRSNPPTNPNHNSKRKKSSSSKKPSTSGGAISESDLDDQRTMGSEDSSCGVVQLSGKDDDQSPNQTTESNDSNNGTSRPLITTETNSNPTTRNLIIADSSVGETLKLQNTAVLVPGNYIMPVSMVKGGQQIAVVSGGSKILATVPARSGPNMLLFQSFLNQNRKPGGPTVKYSTLQPLSGLSSQNLAGVSGQSQVILPQNAHNLTAVTLGQPLTLKKIEDPDNRVNTELLLAIAQPRNDGVNITETSPQSDGHINVQSANSIKLDDNDIQTNNSSGRVYTYQKSTIATPIATSVISQSSQSKNELDENNTIAQPSIITLNISPEKTKDDPSKTVKRMQSVLVTTCASNGPMLSQTPPRYRKSSDSTPVTNEMNLKGGYLHNGEKQKEEVKTFQTAPVYFPNKIKKIATNIRGDKELQQLCLQRKQAALDRELRLQKSLSEECEDLGVDEPSTSDLFPEADLLFDTNHSPSFDQTAQDMGKKTSHPDIKDKIITLFSDDDNSSSLRNDFLFDSVQYQTESELQYEQSRQTNGQSSTSNESGSSCEDTTLLQNCASMSDVTLHSPISPEFNDNPTHMNKYKFKYSNRKKTDRHKQVETWTTAGEVSSSEDTMCSELGKMAHSPKSFVIKNSSCDEDEEFKFVRVSISKTDLAREEESCEELHYEDDLDSPSGRGARRSVKKMCSCCNGSQGGNRKRPSSQSHTPGLHKKAFINKKR